MGALTKQCRSRFTLGAWMTNKSEANFDAYKEGYSGEVQRSIDFIRQDHSFFIERKVEHLLALSDRHLGTRTRARVLDVGCGSGLTDSYLSSRFEIVHGVDISSGMIEKAAKANPSVQYSHYTGERLPFPDESFDLVFAMAVLHHVPPASWSRFVVEMSRVTSSRGLIVIFEHNPFNPLTRLAVARCEFDADAVLLSKSRTAELLHRCGVLPLEATYIIFFPWRIPALDAIERTLRKVPLGAQYYVAGRKVNIEG